MQEYNSRRPYVDKSTPKLGRYAFVENSEGWREKAACRDVDDPELFFPVGNTGPAARQIERAKTICNTCLGRAGCLKFAMEHGLEAGVWGGLSEVERRGLKRRAVRRFNVNVVDDPKDLK